MSGENKHQRWRRMVYLQFELKKGDWTRVRKHYPFALQKTAKKAFLVWGPFSQEIFWKFTKLRAKPTCSRWKIGLFSNRIRLNFENQLSRTTIHFTLKTSGKSCVRKWRVWSKQAIVLSPKLNNNGCQDWDNAHSRKPLHCKKKCQNCCKF